MGDGDHGTAISNGFIKVKERLTGASFDDLGELFKTIGITIMMNTGGASGGGVW